jgi:hypothetical protein
MSSINSAKQSASRYINAHCVSVEEMGTVDMGFGPKPMGRFIFEGDEVNGYGGKRRYTRLFHLHTHPMSAVSQAVKSWCDRDLAAEEEDQGKVNWQSFVNKRACLKLEPGAVKNGQRFENITEILGSEDEANSIGEPKENDLANRSTAQAAATIATI